MGPKCYCLVGVLIGSAIACKGDTSMAKDSNPPPDVGSNPPCDSCNPLTQSGCGTRDKCSFAKVPPESSCDIHCAVPGPLSEGMPCDFPADACSKGLQCVEGTCRAFCDLTSKPCQTGVCPGRSFAPVPFFNCSPPCDPLSPNCGPGKECVGNVHAGIETPGCVVPGVNPLGSECTQPQVCASGLTCTDQALGPNGFPTCRQRCLVAANDCASPEVCRERQPGIDGYGVCL